MPVKFLSLRAVGVTKLFNVFVHVLQPHEGSRAVVQMWNHRGLMCPLRTLSMVNVVSLYSCLQKCHRHMQVTRRNILRVVQTTNVMLFMLRIVLTVISPVILFFSSKLICVMFTNCSCVPLQHVPAIGFPKEDAKLTKNCIVVQRISVKSVAGTTVAKQNSIVMLSSIVCGNRGCANTRVASAPSSERETWQHTVSLTSVPKRSCIRAISVHTHRLRSGMSLTTNANMNHPGSNVTCAGVCSDISRIRNAISRVAVQNDMPTGFLLTVWQADFFLHATFDTFCHCCLFRCLFQFRRCEESPPHQCSLQSLCWQMFRCTCENLCMCGFTALLNFIQRLWNINWCWLVDVSAMRGMPCSCFIVTVCALPISVTFVSGCAGITGWNNSSRFTSLHAPHCCLTCTSQ